MEFAYLESANGNGSYKWSDTGKNARIRENLGSPRTIDISPPVAEYWRENPLEFAAFNAPRMDLPKKTEVSFIVLEKRLEVPDPSMKVQYVVARR